MRQQTTNHYLIRFRHAQSLLGLICRLIEIQNKLTKIEETSKLKENEN